MKIVFLDRETLGDACDEQLKLLGEYTSYQTTLYDQTVERCKEADVVITNKVVFDKEILNKLPNLKMIAIAATGMNKVDLEEAKKLGIVVRNVNNYSTESVVQLAFSMALYFQSNMNYYSKYTKSKSWSQSATFNHIGIGFNELSGKTWGIIGLGTIGKRVAEVASAFGVSVIYYSTTGKNNNSNYKQVKLDELLSQSDIISIHSPLNDKTKDLIRKRELNFLKDNVTLLNLARGEIVNENDLVELVKNGKNINIGFDVISKEPLPINHPFNVIIDLDNVVITPHIAWTSIEARDRLMTGIFKNIKGFIDERK